MHRTRFIPLVPTVSTLPRYRAKELVHGLKFEADTYYPQFHHAVVKVVVRKVS